MKTIDMEVALAYMFNFRQNLIVPCISWGIAIHECDLLVVTKSGYLFEIEIKVSPYDLINDKNKKHKHDDNRIKRLYFAIPDEEKMIEVINHIPKRAGILIVKERGNALYHFGYTRYIDIMREPIENKNAPKMSDNEIGNIAKLCAMRIWTYKKRIAKLSQ